MAYSTDADLQKVRPDILDLGTPSWSTQIGMAEDEINRYLETNWYRAAAEQRGINWRDEDYAFDPSNLLKPTQVNMASVYLSLSMAYDALAKNREDDGFTPQRDHWRDRFNTEIEAVVLYGMDYDWPDQGEAVAEERMPRTLVRG